jgi:hypothetical protein
MDLVYPGALTGRIFHSTLINPWEISWVYFASQSSSAFNYLPRHNRAAPCRAGTDGNRALFSFFRKEIIFFYQTMLQVEKKQKQKALRRFPHNGCLLLNSYMFLPTGPGVDSRPLPDFLRSSRGLSGTGSTLSLVRTIEELLDWKKVAV